MARSLVWYCRVCGLDYDVSPWGPADSEPDHSSCACCGVEFGYEDRQAASATAYRSVWLGGGAKWFYPNVKPADWDVEAQLAQIPAQYR